MMYKWLHRVASQTPHIRDMFRDWAVEVIKAFRDPNVALTSVNGEPGELKAREVPQMHMRIDNARHLAWLLRRRLNRPGFHVTIRNRCRCRQHSALQEYSPLHDRTPGSLETPCL